MSPGKLNIVQKVQNNDLYLTVLHFSKFPMKNSGGLILFLSTLFPFIINGATNVNNIKIIIEIFNFHINAKNLLYAPRQCKKVKFPIH